MALISIIVPVYNVEEYLEECLDSILAQTYKEIELILVNDGSTDRSGVICDRYAALDNRVNVFHQENQGLSATRNKALAIANGEYLTFVDSDDYIATDMIGLMYNNLKRENAQVSICGIWLAYEKYKQKRQMDDIYLKMNTQEALEKMLGFGYYDISAGAKLYKTDLFHGVRFPVGIIAEDMHVTPKAMAKATCIVYDSSPKYYYRQHQGSITKIDSFWISYLDGMKVYLDFVTDLYPDLKAAAQCLDLYAYLMIYATLLRRKDMHSILNDIYPEIVTKAKGMKDPEKIKTIPIKSRISLWLLLHSRMIHSLVYKLYWALSLKSFMKGYCENEGCQELPVYHITPSVRHFDTVFDCPIYFSYIWAVRIGIVAYTNAITMYFVLFANFGLAVYGNRCIAQCRDDLQKCSATFWEIMLLKIGLTSIALFCFWVFVVSFSSSYQGYFAAQSLLIIANAVDTTWFCGQRKF